MDIKKLKEREFVNVERNASIIASKLREIDQVDEAKIIATAYLAYLVKKEELPNENELIKFIIIPCPIIIIKIINIINNKTLSNRLCELYVSFNITNINTDNRAKLTILY